jgi:frataxin-like iron-binding protein CyaY
MNRFFKVYDSTIDKIESIKLEYDSKYKYKFAIQQVKKTDNVLTINNELLSDYLINKAKKCINIDISDQNINFDFKLLKFDKIIFIDVFSKLKMITQEIVLSKLHNILKQSGKIIITDTHPFLNINRFIRLVEESQFNFYGEVDYIMDYKDILQGKCIGNKNYGAVLSHVGIRPREIKPDGPMEIK